MPFQNGVYSLPFRIGTNTPTEPQYSGQVGADFDDIAGIVNMNAIVLNVKAFGVVGDGNADDTAAIQAAIDACTAAGGGIVFFPTGNYYVTGTLVIDNNNVSLLGAGINAVSITAGLNNGGSSYNDITVLQLTSNCNYITISDLSVRGKGGWQDTGTFGATNPTVEFQSGCGSVTLRKVRIDGGAQNISISGFDHLLDDIVLSNAYDALFKVKEQGNFFRRIKADSGLSSGDNAGYPIRSNTNPYVVGDLVTNNDGTSNCVLYCKVAGTSGGSTPTNLNYGRDITDGGVTWEMSAPVDLICVHCESHDGGGGEWHFEQIDLSGTFASSLVVDDDNSNDNAIVTFAQSIFSSPIVIGNAKWVGFSLCEFGTSSFTPNDKPITITGCWASSALTPGGAGTVLAGNINIT